MKDCEYEVRNLTYVRSLTYQHNQRPLNFSMSGTTFKLPLNVFISSRESNGISLCKYIA